MYATHIASSCDRYDVRWRQTPLRCSNMLSSLAAWTTATVFWLVVLAPVYWEIAVCSCNHQHSKIWPHYTCVAWSALAFDPPANCLKTAILVHNCHGLALSHLTKFIDQWPLFQAVDSNRPPPCSNNTAPLAAEVSQSAVQSHGTVYLLSCEHSICLLRRSPSYWRRISSTVIDCSLQCICCTLIDSNLRLL